MSSPDTTDRRIEAGMRAQLALRGAMFEAGRKHLGWKLGFGSPAAMQRLGTTAPLVGFLTDQSLLQSGATCSIAGWKRAMLEPEVAAHIGAGGAIEALGVAIEIVDLDAAVQDVEEILAGDIFHRHVLLGPQDVSRAGGSVAGVSARVLRNGEQIASTSDPEATTGRVTEIVASAGATLEANGLRLEAGDVVILGSVVPPIQVAAGETIRVEMTPLGELEVSFV
jgi:2-keto-4-pentenoate hydratase